MSKKLTREGGKPVREVSSVFFFSKKLEAINNARTKKIDVS
jgi:hypothetical protein